MRKQELIEYLETKILDGTIRDDEYGLYLEYKQYGIKVLDWSEHLCKRIRREYKKIYGEV